MSTSVDIIYTRGVGFTKEMWDDSELIAAWQRQVMPMYTAETHGSIPNQVGATTIASEIELAKMSLAAAQKAYEARLAQHTDTKSDSTDESVPSSDTGLRKIIDDNGTLQNDNVRKRSREHEMNAIQLPPLPPFPNSITTDEKIRAVLRDWYYAGYWAGRASMH